MAVRGESVQVGPWTGGVNYAVPAEDLGPTELFSMENMRVGIGGEVSKRGGIALYNSSAISGTPTITGLVEHRFSASSSKGYVIAGAKIYEDNLSASFTDRTSSMTITAGDDNTFTFANFRGDFYATNGVAGDTLLRITAAGNNAAAADVDSRFTTAKAIEVFDNRLWWGNLSSGVDRVWRSDLADATVYGANAFFQVGEDVTGLSKLGNALSIHTADSIHLAIPTGNAALPYRLVQRANAGAVGERAIVNVQIPGSGEVIIYVREDGVYQFDGNNAQKISWKLDGARYWDDLNKSRLHKAFIVKYPKRNEVWIWVPNGDSQTTMNQAIVYDYVRQIWYGPFTGVTRNCGALLNREPHFGGHSSGRVFTHESATMSDLDGANTTGIDAFMETASSTPMGTDVMLRWLFLRTSFDVLGNYAVLVTYTGPGIVGESDTISMLGGFDAIETAFTIAESSISADASLASSDTDLGGYAPSIKVRFANSSAAEDFKIRRARAVYKPLGRVRKASAGIN